MLVCDGEVVVVSWAGGRVVVMRVELSSVVDSGGGRVVTVGMIGGSPVSVMSVVGEPVG